MAVKKSKKAVQKNQQTEKMVLISDLNIKYMDITLESDSSLICHRWSDKAKKEIRDKQMKRAPKAKEAKDPEKDFLASLYKHPDGGYGFPAVAFKSAAVDACSQISGLTKVQIRGVFHIDGELVKISGKPTMREDMVRIGMGTADIRHRGEFKKWSATFTLRYNASVVSPEQLVALFQYAGFAVGVGEWRPQKDGIYGMFHVKGRKAKK